jgi:hypothetical protein
VDSETLVSENRSPEASVANLPGPDYQCPVFEWTENFGRYAESIPTLIEEVGRRFQECGLPLARLSVVIRALHSQIAAAGFVWNGKTREMTEFTGDHQSQSSESFQRSPVRVVFEGPLEYPILEQMRDEGITDYISLPMAFSDGAYNPISRPWSASSQRCPWWSRQRCANASRSGFSTHMSANARADASCRVPSAAAWARPFPRSSGSATCTGLPR